MSQQIRKYGRNVTFPTSYFVKLNYKIVKNQSRPITSHEIEGVIKFPSKEKPKADGITAELYQSLKKLQLISNIPSNWNQGNSSGLVLYAQYHLATKTRQRKKPTRTNIPDKHV